MRSPAVKAAAATAGRSAGSIRGRLIVRPRRSGCGTSEYTQPECRSEPRARGGPLLRIKLRYPATPENARDHAQIAVLLAREEYESELDFSPGSLEIVDAHIDSLREEGIDGEGAAETLFVLGCYLGEVMVRHLGGVWVATTRSPLRGVSPWPMVVALARRLGVGRDREGVQAAGAGRRRVPAGVLRDGGRWRSRRRGERPRTTRRSTGPSRSRSPATSTCTRSFRARSLRWSRSTCGRAVTAGSCACGWLTGAGEACSARWCGGRSRRCRRSSRSRTRQRRRAVGERQLW